MREKLIEILCSAYIPITNGNVTVGEFSIAIDEAEVLADHLIANGVTIPVRCKECKHWIAEDLERCKALKQEPYGLCLKHRCLPLAGYHEYRNQDDFCSYGERRTDEREAD